MKLLLVFVVLSVASASLDNGNFECYLCAGPSKGGCANGNPSSMVKQACNRNATFAMNTNRELETNEISHQSHRIQNYCVKFTVPEGESEAYIRSCLAYSSNVDPCKFIEKFWKSRSCKSCDTPLCNK